jgi:predicted alpha/beta-fold hydrolase
LRPFEPFFKNPHLATLAGNFWTRPVSEARWPAEAVLYRTEPDVQVLVHTQRPDGAPRGDVILVHGLEGSSESGYARSMAFAALERGYAAHRFNMRGCGGTEALALMSYHAGQTSDLFAVIKEIAKAGRKIFIVGYSLGANVALKLAGELGEGGRGLLAGVCAVSAPIDLSACAHALNSRANFLYQNRFLDRLKERIRRKNRLSPDVYTLEHLPKVRSIVDFDDHYTARLFGFGTAANYFRTQSANQFLEHIQVPALIVTAQDDPLVPFQVYDHPALGGNPAIRFHPVPHGGHLGFIARNRPRFWLDDTILDWMAELDGTGVR